MRRLAMVLVAVALSTAGALGQTSYTSNSATTAWNAARWNNSANESPYTSAYTANNNVEFTSGTYTFTTGIGSGTINVGNVSLSDGVTVNFTGTVAGTFATSGSVRTFTVGTGAVLDFASQSFSTASGTGFVKNGAGTLALAGNTYNGGFTLNQGTVILRGVNALGGSAINILTLNGGVVASNGNRSMDTTKYGGGIIIGGNVQFGELATVVSIASSTANLSFANNVSLGNANRTLTLGNNGTQTFSGIISNIGSGGITFAANAGTDGRFEITNAANTFTGDITITGGEVRFTADGSLGNVNNSISIDGGRFATGNSATYAVAATRNIFVGDTAGTSISTPGSGTLTYNGVIADATGKTGVLVKQGGGTLSLGGVSTYTGSTSINNGFLQLTTGNDRLPTGTVLNLGQAASANLGTLDLNGRNQQVAGLNSVAGTNATASNNTITSATAATLTINGGGSYGSGTNENSGVITGSISLIKTGSGTLSLGDANTYSGTTSVNGGTLLVNGNQSSATGDVSVASTATLGGSGTIGGATTVLSGGTLQSGNSGIGTLAFNNNVTIDSGGTVQAQIGAGTGTGTSDTLNLSGGTGTRSLTFASGSNLNLDGTAGFNATAGTTYTLANLGDAGLSFGGVNVAGDFATYTNNGTFTTNGVNVTVSGFTFNTGDQLILRRTGTELQLVFSPVPEPTTILGVAVGLVAVGGFIRKRLAKKAVVAA